MASSSSQPIKGAYWPSWDRKFPTPTIERSLFTHIYYAFLTPNNVTFKFHISDSTATMLSKFTSTLHRKTLFSIGRASADPLLFASMASTSSPRKIFIDSTIEVARKFGFDGIDLYWQYPQSPKEMEQLGHLLDEWRAEVQKESRSTNKSPLLLTAALYFSVNFFLSDVDRAYPVALISKNLDWINVMGYDYRGSWDTMGTGARAAWKDPYSNISTSSGLESWINAGLPPSKLIMGVPFFGRRNYLILRGFCNYSFGRTWELKYTTSHGIGDPAVGAGLGDNGQMTYFQVEKFNRENNIHGKFDKLTVSTYSHAGTSWIGDDDATSVAVKITNAKKLGLRGYFFWAVNGDYEWKISKTASEYLDK